MRIVDVNEYYSPTGGGVRTYLDRKMEIMAGLGHELIVVAPALRNEVEERPGGGRIHWLKSVPLVLDRNYCIFVHDKPLLRLLDQLDPDVVENSSPWMPAWTIGDWRGRALKVFFAHNDNLAAYPQRFLAGVSNAAQVDRAFGFYTRYMRRFLTRYDTVVTNGPVLAERYRRRGIEVDKAVPLGIERGYFSPDLRDERLRAALLAQCGLPPDGHLLLGLGRHHAEKRWPMVVHAVEGAGSEIPVGLVLIGDGPDRARLEARIADSPHIRIFRPLYDRLRLSRIMASCDALIHGADTEPFGLVAAEALASGLPLIVPEEGGAAQFADPLYAETFRRNDAHSASDAIRRMFARQPKILRAAARHAAGKVRTDEDHTVELLDYYAGLIAERAGAAPISARTR